MRPDPRRRRIAGFAVAGMLVLVAILALATGGALQDVLFAQQLSGARQQQQRAMGMAELGLRIGSTRLAHFASAQPDSGALHPGTRAADSVRVLTRPGAVRIPDGFSAGRFIQREYELESTGRSAQGAQRVLVQGMARLEPRESAP